MLSKYAHILAAVALLGIATSLSAQEKKWYGSVGAGAALLNDTSTSVGGVSLSTEYSTGFLITGAVGRFFDRFRGELELNYMQSDLDKITVSGFGVAGSVSADGDVSATSLMVNGYYEFDTGTAWSPYLGGGIGGANVSVNDVGANGVTLLDDSATVLAYQAKAGIAYRFNENIDGTFGYRYFATDDLDMSAFGTSFTLDGPESHNFEIAVRFRF